jgi:hypothetical protein
MRLNGESVSRLRVTRKLARHGRGAVNWTQMFGEGLVCVRHRTDPDACMRYVTVEIVVAQATIKPKAEPWVCIRIFGDEVDLQRALRLAGGRWDAKARLWHAPRKVAMALSLADRITTAT